MFKQQTIKMAFYPLDDWSVSDNRDNSATMRATIALALAQYEDLF